jgi:hypothetical protein
MRPFCTREHELLGELLVYVLERDATLIISSI